MVRHMSLSSTWHGRMPIPEAVWMVCDELGFTASLDACNVWLEDIGDGDRAVNVVQPVAIAEVAHA
jgi:hypothetical protein